MAKFEIFEKALPSSTGKEKVHIDKPILTAASAWVLYRFTWLSTLATWRSQLQAS